jgi:hypothetical protein
MTPSHPVAPMNETTESFEGACHCGAIGYAYRTDLPPSAWSVRACQCSFCRSHAGVTTSDPAGSLEFFEHTPGALNRYRFARRTADYLICRNCGIYLGAIFASARGRFGIVNVNTMKNRPADLPPPEVKDYGTETPEQRAARRAQRWTPVAGAV